MQMDRVEARARVHGTVGAPTCPRQRQPGVVVRVLVPGERDAIDRPLDAERAAGARVEAKLVRDRLNECGRPRGHVLRGVVNAGVAPLPSIAISASRFGRGGAKASITISERPHR